MITLKTLPQATAQEAFNQVAKHLLKQGKKSGVERDLKDQPDRIECMYRSPDGLRCAAGCLIGNDEYKEQFEGRSWAGMVAAGHAPKEHSALIRSLQSIHDNNSPSDWPAKLAEVAFYCNLTFTP